MGLAARVAAYRPYFQALALLSLSASYYWIYRKQGQRPNRITLVQIILWAATLLFLADLTLPAIVRWFLL